MRVGFRSPIRGLVTKNVFESPPVRMRLVVPTRKFRPELRASLAGRELSSPTTWLEVVTTIALLLMLSSTALLGVFTTRLRLVVLELKLFSGSVTVRRCLRMLNTKVSLFATATCSRVAGLLTYIL